MGQYKLALSFTVAAAIILLAGCAGGSSTGPVAGTGLTPITSQVREAGLNPPGPCPPKMVWVASLLPPKVQGYDPGAGYFAPGVPCGPVNTGITSGTNFGASFGLATDKTGNLYVADVNNRRVVVFKPHVNAWRATMNINPSFQPLGVCVSPPGIFGAKSLVGVVDRNSVPGGPGDVEFFTDYTFGAPTGAAVGGTVINTFQWCAFDAVGNFFATGTTTAGVQKIVYLNRALVNTGGPIVLDPLIAAGPYWVSMFAQGELLTVADINGPPNIKTFKITPATGIPGPAVFSTVPLAGYPNNADNMDQMAPNGPTTKATVYFANYGAKPGEVEQILEYQGIVKLFRFPVERPVGIATLPTGQD